MVLREPTILPRGPSRYRARFLMGVFLLAGILLMLAHHSLHMYLDGKPVDSNLFSIHGFSLNDQSVSSILGNAIAYVARTVLSAGIGIVFIQVLWSKLRREQFTVKQMDALVACKGEPFALSALPTWLLRILARSYCGDGDTHGLHIHHRSRISPCRIL